MGFWRRATKIYLGECRFCLRGSVWTSGVLLRGDVSQRGGVTWGVAHWWTDSSCLQRWTLNQHQRSSEVTYGLFRQVGFPEGDKKNHDAEKLLGSRKATTLWNNCAVKKFVVFTPRQTFWVMKSSGMKRVRHVASIQANRRNAHSVLVAKPQIKMSSCIPCLRKRNKIYLVQKLEFLLGSYSCSNGREMPTFTDIEDLLSCSW